MHSTLEILINELTKLTILFFPAFPSFSTHQNSSIHPCCPNNYSYGAANLIRKAACDNGIVYNVYIKMFYSSVLRELFSSYKYILIVNLLESDSAHNCVPIGGPRK